MWLDVRMDLKTFLEEGGRRQSLADAVGMSPDYLWQIATGWQGRKPSPKLARKISDATHGVVSLAELRPDVWGAPSANPKAAA